MFQWINSFRCILPRYNLITVRAAPSSLYTPTWRERSLHQPSSKYYQLKILPIVYNKTWSTPENMEFKGYASGKHVKASARSQPPQPLHECETAAITNSIIRYPTSKVLISAASSTGGDRLSPWLDADRFSISLLAMLRRPERMGPTISRIIALCKDRRGR